MTSFLSYIGAAAAAVRRPASAGDAPPWMQRADWAARVVVDRAAFSTAACLSGFSVVWCGACVFIFLVNHDRSAAGGGTTWGDIFFALIFPLSAVAAVAYTIARRAHVAPLRQPGALHRHAAGIHRRPFSRRRDAAAAGYGRPRSHHRLRAADLSLGAQDEGRPQKGVEHRDALVERPSHRRRPRHAHRGGRQRARRCAAAGRSAGDVVDAEGVGIRWSLYVRTAHERKGTAGAVGTIEPESEPPPSYAAQFVVPVYARD